MTLLVDCDVYMWGERVQAYDRASKSVYALWIDNQIYNRVAASMQNSLWELTRNFIRPHAPCTWHYLVSVIGLASKG